MPAGALATAAAAAAAAGDPSTFPGPGPWDARAWLGAALYVALFLAALAGTWVLVRGCPDGEGP